MDLETGLLRIRRNRLRPKYKHGCGGTCGRKAGYCPERKQTLWHEEGWVFAKPDGKPLNPNTDYHEWKALIEEAGLPDRRLHDARHTAATVLAILNVPTTHAMAIMGWSSAEMAARYQHVLDSIRKGVADQVGGLLWDDDETTPPDHDGGNSTT